MRDVSHKVSSKVFRTLLFRNISGYQNSVLASGGNYPDFDNTPFQRNCLKSFVSACYLIQKLSIGITGVNFLTDVGHRIQLKVPFCHRIKPLNLPILRHQNHPIRKSTESLFESHFLFFGFFNLFENLLLFLSFFAVPHLHANPHAS